MNDIFGATKIEWNKSVWASDLDYGLRMWRLGVDTHAITSYFAIPLLIAWRYLTEVQDQGKPADVTGYR